MQEIDDQYRQWQATPLEFPRHAEKLFLRLVAQLALPESGGPVGKLRRVTGYVGIVLHDLGIGIARGDVVVQLPAAVGDPAGPVVAQLDPAQRRIVPEKSVSFAGDEKGHDMFDMSLVEVDHAAFQIEPARGVQPHAVEAFAIARGEMHFGVGETVV